MKRLSTLLIAVALPTAFAIPALAQEGQTLGVVQRGNTIIEFKAADTSDIDMAKLKTWHEFAEQHPKIASQLGYHPSLVKNDAWVNKHPELAQFFAQHPDIHDAMEDDPGNFVAPPVNG